MGEMYYIRHKEAQVFLKFRHNGTNEYDWVVPYRMASRWTSWFTADAYLHDTKNNEVAEVVKLPD